MERDQTSYVARGGQGSGIVGNGPTPGDEQPSKAAAGGTAGDDPLAGVHCEPSRRRAGGERRHRAGTPRDAGVAAPLDEDAAALAQIAETAAKALDDATQPGVGYPGPTYPHDVAEVLDALASLAGGLQGTVAHLRRFLDEALDAGRLTGVGDSTGPAAVSATRARLHEAYAARR